MPYCDAGCMTSSAGGLRRFGLSIIRAVCLDLTLQTAAGPLDLRSIHAFILFAFLRRCLALGCLD